MLPQHIQSQLYDLITHRFDTVQIDRFSMEKSDWNLNVPHKFSFIMSVRKDYPFKVMVSEIVKTDYAHEAFWLCKRIEDVVNENIKNE